MLLLHNANIPTLPKEIAHYDAILVDDHPEHLGRILDLGQGAALQPTYGSLAQNLDMQGQTILPGFVDAHIHFRRYSLSLDTLDVDTNTLDECLERVAQHAEKVKPGTWIIGHGWRQNNWAEGFGNADLLDRVAPHHPVYLTAASLHAGWANGLALQLASITDATPDPSNGRIDRDSNKRATGILFEKAMQLIKAIIPEASEAETIVAMQKGQQKLWEMGITGIHDFDRLRSFRALQRMHANKALKLRVLKNLPVEALNHIVASGIQSGFGDDFLRIGGIKDFADGALGPRTAAMLDPYEGESSNKGMLLADAEQIVEWGEIAVQAGLSMTVHAIGDRANHEVLNAFERIRAFESAHGLAKRRHRIEHVQIIHPKDMARLGQLGIAASVQPIHGPSDMEAADLYWGKRTKDAYAWKSIITSGAPMAFGSDAPVENPNPFWAIHAAVTRQDRFGKPEKKGWHTEQRITLAKAIQAFTEGPAFLSGSEQRIGRIQKGYLADLIVLKDNPFELADADLRDIKVNATMLGGKWVWEPGIFEG